MKCSNLSVWQRSVELSSEIYSTLSDLKDYGFKDQITRSGLSVPSNIAEGIERISDKEKMRFLYIALGSASELETQIIIANKLGYLNSIELLSKEINEIKKMLYGLISSLKSKL